MSVAEALAQHPDLSGNLVDLGVQAAVEAMGKAKRKPRAMVEWQHDPVGWAERFLGIPAHTIRWSLNDGYGNHEWDGTEDPIAALLEAVARGEDAGVESGTGTGKSFILMVLALWFLAVFEDARVNTYAPKEKQLKLYMWAEIEAVWPKFKALFPDAVLGRDLSIRIWGDKWGAQGIATQVRAGEKSATKAQGAHAEHMLLIVEEGPGVHPAVYRALENTRTDDHNIQVVVGNPDARTDPLHEWCGRPWVTHIVASALDHPNVVSKKGIIPGAVSSSKIARRRILYADRPEMFDSRVRGISPEYKSGLALRFRKNRHLLVWDGAMREKALSEGWKWYAGIDFGAWRFSFLLGVVDRVGRLWVVGEYFSGFGVSLTERSRDIHELLDGVRGSVDMDAFLKRLTFVGDAANATDILEINRAWKRMESPVKVRATAMTTKARATAVERLNDLLAVNKLAVSRSLGAGLEWRKGASTSYQGDEETGSRLLWELGQWAYPEPTSEEKAQREDPDDNTADGADAIAALRYLVMTWLEATKPDIPKKKRNRNIDRGLDKIAAEAARQYRERRIA